MMKRNFLHKTFLFFTTTLLALNFMSSCSKDSQMQQTQEVSEQGNSVSENSNPQKQSSVKVGTTTSTKINENEIVFVEGGAFLMGTTAGSKEDIVGKGSGSNKPQHKVTLSSFKITKYEITMEQFAKFLSEKGNQVEKGRKWYSPDDANFSDFDIKGNIFTPKKGREKMPIRFVTWEAARAFSQWAGGRLPTESEWEYASKGGKKSKGYVFSGSDDINQVGWYEGNSGGKLHNVGEKNPNELGIYDMSGNVWEWTADWFGAYTKEDKVNPKGPEKGNARVRRGASAYCPIERVRSVNRSTSSKGPVRHNMGFRVVFDVK